MNFAGLIKRSFTVFAAFSMLLFIACGGGESGGPGTTPTPNISLDQSVDFEGTLLTSGTGQIFIITNTGNANLSIGQITKPGLPFSIPDVNDFCSNKTLSPSQTCALMIRFSPAAQGPHAGSFAIPSNDPDSGNLSVSLSGLGYGLNVWVNQVSTDCTDFSVEVTVTDPSNPANNAALRGLNASYFTLSGGPFTITPPVSNTYPAPVSLVIALDSSESLFGIMTDIKAAATALINALDDQDEAAICKFYNTIDLYPAAAPLFRTADAAGKADLNAYIAAPFSGQYTRLYDAIVLSIDRAAQGTPGKRKAVVVISDGVDFTSTGTTTADAVIAYAVSQGVSLFTVYDVDPAYGGGTYGNTEVMQRLARETGGQYYYSDTADLASVIDQIASVLSNKYTIQFTSSAPVCSGTLDVRVDWNGLYGQGLMTFP